MTEVLDFIFILKWAERTPDKLSEEPAFSAGVSKIPAKPFAFRDLLEAIQETLEAY
jgi:hypothetical protein